MVDTPLLAVENIETKYGRSQVLFGVSLQVAPGEMITLMGRNGMGKTTTVRSIMGMTPAASGSIRFDGKETRTGRSRRSSSYSRVSPNGVTAWATSFPAGSSRCSRSAARS